MVNVKEFLRRHTTPNQLPFSIHSLTVDEVEYVSRQHELPFNLSKDMKKFDIVVKTCRITRAQSGGSGGGGGGGTD